MGLSIQKFMDARALGGDLKLQRDGTGAPQDIVKGATSFKGKVVAFLRKTFTPGTVARENRGVMEAFITSIGSSRFRYGEEFGDMARQMLAGDMRAGRPLTGRRIGQVVDAMNQHKAEVQRQNVQTATSFASLDRDSDFRTIFAEVLQAKGLPGLPERYDTSALRAEIMEGAKFGGGDETSFRPLSRNEVEALARRCIEDFTAKPQKAMAVVDQTLPKTSEDYEALASTALQSHAKIKAPSYLQGVMAMRETVSGAVTAMIQEGKSPGEVFTAMKGFSDALVEKMSAMGLELGVDDMHAFFQDCLNFACNSGSVSKGDMKKAMALLGSKSGDEIRGAYVTLLTFSVREERSAVTQQTAGRVEQLFNAMVQTMGARTGVSETDRQALTAHPQVASPGQGLSPAFRRALESAGLGAPILANGVNDHLEGRFDGSFTRSLEARLNALYTDGEDTIDAKGRGRFMLADVERCHTTIDGVSIGKQDQGKIAQDWEKKIFTRKDGSYDLEGSRALTALLNQGFSACVSKTMTEVEDGDGIERPFIGNIGARGGLGGEDTTYTVSTDQATGDLWVRMEYRCNPLNIMRMDEPGVQWLDPDKSSYTVAVQVRVPRESIDSGHPRVEVMATHYDATFIEGEQPG